MRTYKYENYDEVGGSIGELLLSKTILAEDNADAIGKMNAIRSLIPAGKKGNIDVLTDETTGKDVSKGARSVGVTRNG